MGELLSSFLNKPPPPSVPLNDNSLKTAALNKLEETLTMTNARIDILKSRIERRNVLAKAAALQDDRPRAILHLQAKRMYCANINALTNSMVTIERQILSIEQAAFDQLTYGAMSEGASLLKIINSTTNVDEVANTMDDMQETLDMANEISTILGSSVPFADVNDEELELELQQLMEELTPAKTEERLLDMHRTLCDPGEQTKTVASERERDKLLESFAF